MYICDVSNKCSHILGVCKETQILHVIYHVGTFFIHKIVPFYSSFFVILKIIANQTNGVSK